MGKQEINQKVKVKRPPIQDDELKLGIVIDYTFTALYYAETHCPLFANNEKDLEQAEITLNKKYPHRDDTGPNVKIMSELRYQRMLKRKGKAPIILPTLEVSQDNYDFTRYHNGMPAHRLEQFPPQAVHRSNLFFPDWYYKIDSQTVTETQSIKLNKQ
jgi:hypothetical protein